MPKKKRTTLPEQQTVLTAAEQATQIQAAVQKEQRIAAAPKEAPLDVDYLVSLTFDNDPAVRKRTAETLGKLDDPRAIFALLELSSDKEPTVQEAARAALDKFKTQKDEQEAIVTIEQLLAERKVAKIETPEATTATKQRLMPTLEKLFHHDEKSPKGAREKILSSLMDKFFTAKKPADYSDSLSSIEHVHGGEKPQNAQPASKDALTHDEITQIRAGHDEVKKPVQVQEEEEMGEIYSPPSTPQAQEEAQEEMRGEIAETAPIAAPASQDAKPFYYKLAYDLAKTAGTKKNVLVREQKRIIANLKKDVELAFKLAASKAEEEGSPSLSNLKPGLKHLSLAPMQISSISEIQYGKKGAYSKIALSDGKKSVPLLVPKERASGISVTDQLSLKDVQTDFMVETGELVLILSPNSKMLIMR
ncbi:HEAT repeats [Candidatus Anstonella stagnisolia]|nr:HEAT repeats [Candidatus Anstonella stagnisolia]